MRGTIIASLLILAVCVLAQSLPSCAQKCVSSTRTKCKSTDYKCACLDRNYMPRLMECISKECDDGPEIEATSFLVSLCRTFGAPIDHLKIDDHNGGQLELRDVAVQIRQIASFTNEPTFSQTFVTFATSKPNAPNSTAPSQSTSTPSQGGHGGGEKGGSSGLSTGAKVGIGVGVPVGVIIIGLLVGLAYWMGRRSKKVKETTPQHPQQQPPMTGPGMPELDQGAQFLGAEMPTKSNITEMPGNAPGQQSGYNMYQQPYTLAQTGQQQQFPPQQHAYLWPQGQQPQHGQQVVTSELPART